MNVLERISQELGIESWKIEKAVELLDQGSTVPFIARYRKEVTGSPVSYTHLTLPTNSIV